MRWPTILLVALIGPLLFLGWVRSSTNDRLTELEVTPEPVTMTVSATESFDPQGVVATLIWTEAPAVASPPWSGTVTGVEVEPGDVIGTGDVVLTVDGIDRLAYQAESPMFRPLRRADSGPDVETLEGLLAGWGIFDAAPDRSYTSSTAAAVDRLGFSLGVSKPGGVFDPGWLIWVGSKPFAISQVAATTGFPAPAPGTPLLAGLPGIADARLASPNGSLLELAGERVLEIGDQRVAFVDGVADPGELERMSTLVPALSEQTGGTLKLATPRVAYVVPATAIVADEDGATCVFVADSTAYTARPVTLGGGRASTVDVVSGLDDGDQVLVNPGDLFEVPTCR